MQLRKIKNLGDEAIKSQMKYHESAVEQLKKLNPPQEPSKEAQEYYQACKAELQQRGNK